MREALDLAETWSQIAPLLNATDGESPLSRPTGQKQARRKAA